MELSEEFGIIHLNCSLIFVFIPTGENLIKRSWFPSLWVLSVLLELNRIPRREIFSCGIRSADYPQPGVYPPLLFLQGLDATLCPGESMCGGSRQNFHPMKNRGGARGQAAGMPNPVLSKKSKSRFLKNSSFLTRVVFGKITCSKTRMQWR